VNETSCDLCKARRGHHAAECADLKGYSPYPKEVVFTVDGIPYRQRGCWSSGVSVVRPMFELIEDNMGNCDLSYMPTSKTVDIKAWMDNGDIVYTDGTTWDDYYE